MDPIASMRQEITAFEQAAAPNSSTEPTRISEMATKCFDSIQKVQDSINTKSFFGRISARFTVSRAQSKFVKILSSRRNDLLLDKKVDLFFWIKQRKPNEEELTNRLVLSLQEAKNKQKPGEEEKLNKEIEEVLLNYERMLGKKQFGRILPKAREKLAINADTHDERMLNDKNSLSAASSGIQINESNGGDQNSAQAPTDNDVLKMLQALKTTNFKTLGKIEAFIDSLQDKGISLDRFLHSLFKPKNHRHQVVLATTEGGAQFIAEMLIIFCKGKDSFNDINDILEINGFLDYALEGHNNILPPKLKDMLKEAATILDAKVKESPENWKLLAEITKALQAKYTSG